MSLNKGKLNNDIKKLLQDMMQKEENSFDEFANTLSTAIYNFVKTGTVTVQAGIPVSTTGTAAAQTGATTSTATGTIN